MSDSGTAANVPFDEAEFACFDFETTGFSSKRDRVIEVAVVTVHQGKVDSGWTTLIDPGNDVDLGARHIHGIEREWLENAPNFSDIAGSLLRLLDNKVLVAHNANFDLGFLRAELSRAELLPSGILFPHWDTMKAADFAPTASATRKLGDVAAAFGIDIINAHEALDDALAVAEIVAAVTETIGDSIRLNPFSAPEVPLGSRSPAYRP
ncbi:MAG: 3'-5' exonuclease [Actinomycetota bacterium]|nr:3'-5' exonuclease [Actinomycetota bacterium]